MSTKHTSTSANSSYHHGDLKAELLRSAIELLDESGVEKLSLRKVATRAGVSHGAPYRHFQDKESLLSAVAQQGFLTMYEQMVSARDAQPEHDIEARLSALGEAYVRFASTHATHFRLMFGPHMAHEHRHEKVREAGKRCHGLLLDLVERGQAQGFIPAGDPREAALGYWSIVQGLSTLYINGMIQGLCAQPASEPAQLEAMIARVISSFGRVGERVDAG